MRMNLLKIFSFSFFILDTLHLIPATTFHIQNNCPYTVWAAMLPSGGQELKRGNTWAINMNTGSGQSGRIWARTNCKFGSNGFGNCETGDCNGVSVSDCGALTGFPGSPATLAEYVINSSNTDFFDISLINGFNVTIEFGAVPGGGGCTAGIKCAADINGLCPTELRHPGGCNHPCTVFKNQQFCCGNKENCAANTTSYFKFFKDLCPNVYTYNFDDVNNTFTCPTGTNYNVVFCP